MVGFCIENDAECCKAAKDEIIRRYYQALVAYRLDKGSKEEINKISLLMNQAGVGMGDRRVALVAKQKAELTGSPAMALELPNGKIVTGKTSSLFGPSAAVIINSLKALANIEKKVPLIKAEYVTPIQQLKIQDLGNHNPRLHSDEILIALAIAAINDPITAKAMKELLNLKGSEAHSTVILPPQDANVFRKLGINVTCDPDYQHKKLYHRT